MTKIKQLKDISGNFYPVTHKDAIVGIEDLSYLPLSGGEMQGDIDMLDSSIIWNNWDSSIGQLNGQLIITGGEGLVFNGATAQFAGNIIPADGSQNIGYPDKLFDELYINKIIPEEGIFYNDLVDDGRAFITVNEQPVFYTNIDDSGMRKFFLGSPDQEDCFNINVDFLDIYCTAGGTNIYGYLSVSNSDTSSNYGQLSIDTQGRLNIESETGINLNGQVYIPVNNNISWEGSDGAVHSLGIGNTRVDETPVLYTDSCYIDTLYANTVGTLSEPTLTVNTGTINLFPQGTARSKNLLTANRDKILIQSSNEETEALKYFIHIDGISSRGQETFPIDADYCDFAGGIKAGLDIEAVDGFKKTGSTDDYVLLAGGGTKALSEFTTDLSGYLRLSGGTMTGAIDFEWNGPDIHNMLTWRKQGILQLDETDQSKLYLGTAAKLPLTVHELTTNGKILPATSTPEIGMVVAIQPGEPRPTYISLGSTDAYFDKVYARQFKGLANNALKLYTYGTGILSQDTPYAVNVGDVSKPVYFKDGVPVACNSIPTSDTVASWGYVTSSGITKLNVGAGLQGKANNSDPVDAITTSVGTITLKTASNNEIGGIKLGYSTTGKNYPVNVNTEGQAYVNVPWTNTDSKVTQSMATSNGAYPLLCKYDTKPNKPITNSVNFVSQVTVNPSTGAVNASAFYETSDIRKKEIKSDLSLDKCYDLIDKCQTVIYSLKDQTKEQVGMIAQEIEEFFPEVVATNEEGFKSLAYDRLVVICFKVLKDVIKRLEKLES